MAAAPQPIVITDPASLVSAREARAMVGGMDRSTMYKRIKKGKFPKPVKYGSRTFFVRGEIVALCKKLAQEGASAK